MKGALSFVRFALLVALCLLVALVSTRYLFPGAPGAATNVMENQFARWGALTAHVAFAVIALALGPFQFIARLRVKHAALHRRLGTLYVIACLLGGSAGLVLAVGTSAGPIAQAGFGLLAVLWLATTAQAWRLAKARRIAAHQRWMIRSFALTFAAVTLRLYLGVVGATGLDFTEAYRAISFLCWVPNLIVAELMIANSKRRALA